MKKIKEDISNQDYKPIYLLYGTEGYLRRQVKEDFIKAIAGDATSMNYSYYTNDIDQSDEVIQTINTLPFLGERRLVILENTNLFKKAPDAFLEGLKSIPDTTVVVFVEETVDKRGRIYKLCTKEGYTAELNTPDERTLYVWIATLLKKENKKMKEECIAEFVDRVGHDMNLLKVELDKLVSYVGEREIIELEDVDKLATVSVENQIFEMISALSQKNKAKAFSLYDDLLALKEAPIKIMVLITRQYEKLLILRDMGQRNIGSSEIAKKSGLAPFIAKKLMSTANRFSVKEIKEILIFAGQMDEDVKMGRIKDRLAVELLLTKCLTVTNC